MTYQEMLEQARPAIGKYCRACAVCNGKACGNQIPGPGAKGVGDTAVRNYEEWQKIRVNMDTLTENRQVDISFEVFGKKLAAPFFAGPVGAVNLHYGECYDDVTYNEVLVSACAGMGIAAFTGDGTNPKVMEAATQAIAHVGGTGIPTVKPWNVDTIQEKMQLVRDAGAFAAAMDVDAAGLPFLKNMTPPAGSKSVEELSEIAKMAGVPFIVKGVMTVAAALKAKRAGAAAIVVSNHGGRVLDGCPATAEVLEEIVKAVRADEQMEKEDRTDDGDQTDTVGKTETFMKIFVDGGIRSGTDIFRALALGADGVLVCRPFVTAVYGGGAEGVKLYIDKLAAELKDTMAMCGAYTLDEIRRDMVR